MFNLNNEIAIWRENILKAETCTANDLNELESHLLEEIDQLKQKDLSEEEAFLVAVNRIGKPAKVAGEFAKVNTAMVMKNRILLACTGILIFSMISKISVFSSKLIQLLTTMGMQKLATAGPSMIEYFENKDMALSKFIASTLEPLRLLPESAIAYVPTYMQIFFQLAVFALLILVFYKLAKKGKLAVSKSLIIVSVITITALHIAGNFIPAATYKIMSPELIGKSLIVTGIFGLAWTLIVPILLAIVILKLRPKNPALN